MLLREGFSNSFSMDVIFVFLDLSSCCARSRGRIILGSSYKEKSLAIDSNLAHQLFVVIKFALARDSFLYFLYGINASWLSAQVASNCILRGRYYPTLKSEPVGSMVVALTGLAFGKGHGSFRTNYNLQVLSRYLLPREFHASWKTTRFLQVALSRLRSMTIVQSRLKFLALLNRIQN